MGGGLIQLVAMGAQDTFLTGNPQITFFKTAYRRHTNFAVESIEQTLSGFAGFGRKVSCTISRQGDLLTNMWLEVTMPALNDGERWTPRVGMALLKSVELEIGGQRIDKQFGDWLNLWAELTLPLDKKMMWYDMTGRQLLGYNTSMSWNNGQGAPESVIRIPLQFWFNRYLGCALPLIAMQYHDVKVNFEFRPLSELRHWNTPNFAAHEIVKASLWCDYVYLDTDERRKFAIGQHEYLIEQVQVNEQSVPEGAKFTRLDLDFNHPVKELIWYVQKDSFVNGDGKEEWSGDPLMNLWFNYTSHYEQGWYSPNFWQGLDDKHPFNMCTSAKLTLNGHDRFAERDGNYFSEAQVFQHHTGYTFSKGINVYSFALHPEQHQPSGTCNFSRIDNAILHVSHELLPSDQTATIRVYALNYNVLRVMSGMAGVAYSS